MILALDDNYTSLVNLEARHHIIVITALLKSAYNVHINWLILKRSEEEIITIEDLSKASCIQVIDKNDIFNINTNTIQLKIVVPYIFPLILLSFVSFALVAFQRRKMPTLIYFKIKKKNMNQLRIPVVGVKPFMMAT